jgi:hypothetical protein
MFPNFENHAESSGHQRAQLCETRESDGSKEKKISDVSKRGHQAVSDQQLTRICGASRR